jgi:hypothetical protein
MTEMTGRPSTRLEPFTNWTVVTDAPLKGLSFAREAGTILAWDEGNQLYLLSVQGESLSFSRVPNKIHAAAISDDGSLIAVLVEPEDSGLLLLNADFEVEYERAAPSDATFVTIDPHGRYLAVGTGRVPCISSTAMAAPRERSRRCIRSRISVSCPVSRWPWARRLSEPW